MQWQVLQTLKNHHKNIILSIGGIALAIHSIILFQILFAPQGLLLDFFTVASLSAWLITAIVLTSSISKPLNNLFIGIFPIAALLLLLHTFAPHSNIPKHYSHGTLGHILISVLACSILAIATCQALLMASQHAQLKNYKSDSIFHKLPPLQTMDALLFEILWIGIILLTLSLISGLIFIEDIFAQHLVHKTTLSIAAWITFAILLWGRYQSGWRSRKAIHWTIGGFSLLLLAYFGSKFVLELIL